MRLPGVYDIFNDKFFAHTQDTFIISDPHFGDDEIKQAYSNRPSDEELVKLINRNAGRASTLLILGDIGDLSYVRQLRAEVKVCLLGNHDQGKSNYLRKTKTIRYGIGQCPTKRDAIVTAQREYPDYDVVNIEEQYQFHSPFNYWLIELDNKLFDFVFEGPVMLGEKLILSHEPINVSWAFNIHGHNHQSDANDINHLNVCLDATDYKIFNLNQLLKNGITAHIETLHRNTIDKATERKKKR